MKIYVEQSALVTHRLWHTPFFPSPALLLFAALFICIIAANTLLLFLERRQRQCASVFETRSFASASVLARFVHFDSQFLRSRLVFFTVIDNFQQLFFFFFLFARVSVISMLSRTIMDEQKWCSWPFTSFWSCSFGSKLNWISKIKREVGVFLKEMLTFLE